MFDLSSQCTSLSCEWYINNKNICDYVCIIRANRSAFDENQIFNVDHRPSHSTNK